MVSPAIPLYIDATAKWGHYSNMSSLAEIEKAAEALPSEQKEKLILFLGARLRAERVGSPEPRQFSQEQIQPSMSEDRRTLSPAERAADFRRWAASHDSGPGLPDSAVGRDAIYD